MATRAPQAPAQLHFTGNDEADALLASEPLALLIGFVLDQQVSVQKAFSGPLELKRRIGSLDAARIAGMDPGELDRVFRERPALHRFPGTWHRGPRISAPRSRASTAGTRRACGRRPPTAATSSPAARPAGHRADEGPLADRDPRQALGVKPPGWEKVAPKHPTLGDVDSVAALEDYQAKKRAHKAEMRAARART